MGMIVIEADGFNRAIPYAFIAVAAVCRFKGQIFVHNKLIRIRQHLPACEAAMMAKNMASTCSWINPPCIF
jgi:hypothetical protein